MAYSLAESLGTVSSGTPTSAGRTHPAEPPPPLVLHVCGKFHVEHGLGIPEHLRGSPTSDGAAPDGDAEGDGYAPAARVMTVVMLPMDVAGPPREEDAAGELIQPGGEAAPSSGRLGISAKEFFSLRLAELADYVVLTRARRPVLGTFGNTATVQRPPPPGSGTGDGG